ncbi:MAG: hypothetical protein H0T78_09475 [Longispora sp.]|nr:hypothetical protein [Longispora sp. (in: high G+C Gram-positive bacteria)]
MPQRDLGSVTRVNRALSAYAKGEHARRSMRTIAGANPDADSVLQRPFGVTIDWDGSVLIADTYSNKIRKLDGNGRLTTIAGTGQQGFDGDGGLATQAKLNLPRAIAVNAKREIFIADADNNRIRKIDQQGIISTYAGTDTPGGADDKGRVRAVDVLLSGPHGVAVDQNGDVIIADTFNDRIRKIDREGFITFIAGTDMPGLPDDEGRLRAVDAELSGPFGVAVDRDGNIIVADTDNHMIRKIDLAGYITTIAGTVDEGSDGDNGPAVDARLRTPSGVSVDRDGNLFIADTFNHLIRRARPRRCFVVSEFVAVG